MPWKVIEVDAQEEEATVNLTSREQGSALYKVDELARIASDDEDVSDFAIITSTAVCAKAFCISVFNEVHVFDGEQSNCLATLSLESNVDTMAWSPDSQFLVIGDSSGTIHFFSFVRRDVVFSTKIRNSPVEKRSSSSVFTKCMFIPTEEYESVNLMILSADGCLFSFKCLPLSDFSVALESKDVAFISNMKERIQMGMVEVTDVHNKACYLTAANVSGNSAFLVAGRGSAAVSIWSDGNFVDAVECELLDGVGAKKCQVSPNGKYLVVLDEFSNLSIWDTHIFSMLSTPCGFVKDFVLTNFAAACETDTAESNEGQVVLSTVDADHKCQLQIYQLPLFQKTFSLNVSKSCCLAEAYCYHEKVFYIEEESTKINNNSVVDLVYKCLSEASPEHRVYSLVRKKKFDSALEFSIAFGLDPEFVYKAKSSTVLAEISTKISESDRNLEERVMSVDRLIEELKDSLENVHSVEFCVDCCLRASPPKLEQVYRLLCFGKEKASKDSAKDKQRLSLEMNEVLHSIHRLETFRMVFGSGHFTAHKWQQFCKSDMLIHVMQFLSQGKMSNAAIIWRRHQSEFESSLTAESLKNVLVAIRSDLPSSSIISWLKCYLIPFVVCSLNNSDALYVLASWLEQRVTSLELSEKEQWPGNGLAMANLLFDVASECTQENSSYMNIPTPLIIDQVCGTALVQVCKKDSKANPVASLLLLVEHLTELKKLYDNYHTKIPLAEFTKKTPTGIMFKMLDSVLAIELIPSVIYNQITQYGIQHGFQIDEVLLQYMNNKVKQVSNSTLSNTLCEARLVEITKCIKKRALYFEAILELMSWASVPWSSVVEEMVQKAMVADPSNENLKWNYRLMELKKILSNYGLRGIEFSNNSHVKGVVKHILGTSSETALEDALQIVSTYRCLSEEDLYFIRLQNLCVKGLLRECIQLLKMLAPHQVEPVIQKFLVWLSIITEDRMDNTISQECNAISETAVYILEYLQNVCEIDDNMNDSLTMLKNIFSLQNEFSIVTSVSSYQHSTIREEILLKYVADHNMSMLILTMKEENYNSLDKVSRLENLFSISHAQLQLKILLNVLNGSEECDFRPVAASAEWLRKITSGLPSEEVYKLCVALLQQHIQYSSEVISVETDIPDTLYHLACFAVTHGQTVNLDNYLELCKLCWLSTLIYTHCESGDLDSSTSNCAENLLLSWNNASWFQDNGFVLDANVALPLHHQVLKTLLLVQEHPTEFLEKLVIACQNLVFYLQENNLHEVALHYALHSLSHLLQYSEADQEVHNAEQVVSNFMADNPEKITKMGFTCMGVHGVNHIDNMLLDLASKVLHNNSIDHNLALGYLCSIPEEAAQQKLKRDFAVGQIHNPTQTVAAFEVALYYAANFCDHIVKVVAELYSSAVWYSRLQSLNIACGSLLVGEEIEPKKILELLLEKPGLDVRVIIEFCEAFDIEVDAVLHSYILVNLVGCGTSCSMMSLGDENSSKTSMKNFQRNLLGAISCISNLADLLPLLIDVLKSISPYDYEQIEVVLKEIIKVSSDAEQAVLRKQLEVLQILSSYKRTALPIEYEQEYHQEPATASVSEKRVLQHKSSQERLPFHPLIYGKPWKIIAPELSDETIPKLLPLCRLLKIKEDHVYVAAVNKLVSSCLLEQPKKPETSRHNEFSSFNFEKAAKLLSSVSDVEFAVKTAMSLLTKWPQNEEKVKAAKATVDLALKWKSTCGGNDLQRANSIYKLANDMSEEIAIQHVLYSHGITDECFLKLVKKPVKLIFKLYEVYGCISEASRPNVLKMVEEIALISDLNISKIRGRLVETWLPASSPGSWRSAEYSTSENKTTDRDNLKRVMCLLEAGPVEKNALFLLNFAYKNGPKITYESRLRALEILFNIASCEVIESVASDSMDGIRSYMKSLIYLAELEHLHLPQTVESFQRCNKEGLVRGLWKNHKDNSNAVLLIADICLDSKISDSQVWTNILRQLFHLGLNQYLSHLLPCLVKFPNLWLASNLIKIWEQLVLQPLHKVVMPLSKEDSSSCQRSMLLFQKCPILVEVDVIKFFQLLCELDMLSYALACLSLLPDDKKSSTIKAVLSPESVEHILDVIATEDADGKCLVYRGVMEALVFEFVIALNLCESFQSSKHFWKLADYLIAEKKFAGMVLEVIMLGQVELAVELAQHYEMYGPPMKKIHMENTSSMNNLSSLQAFLESARILEDALPYLPVGENLEISDEQPKLNLVSVLESDELGSSANVDIYDVF